MCFLKFHTTLAFCLEDKKNGYELAGNEGVFIDNFERDVGYLDDFPFTECLVQQTDIPLA